MIPSLPSRALKLVLPVLLLSFPVAAQEVLQVSNNIISTLLPAHQGAIKVVVGVKGSFYDPPTISARAGDTIQFVFGGVYAAPNDPSLHLAHRLL